MRLAGAGLAGSALMGVPGCGSGGGVASVGGSGGDPWRRYSGMTLNFASENTAPTSAIAANIEPFRELTGIRVNILQLELNALVQKVALDIGSGQGSYQAIYADPYQILAPYREALASLDDFNADESLPSIPKGKEDFIPAQLDAAGRFEREETLYALPYDCPTMIWMYRKDLFEKYADRMSQDLGFDPMPSDESTWEQYYQIARWFNDNVEEVPYGTGHQAKQHDALMCDFSNVLWSYGGDYFEDGQRVGGLGTADPGPSLLDSPEAIEAANFYKQLLDIAHPASTSWDWNALDEAFRAEQMAMVPSWHENAGNVETSDIAGKVGYARLPQGPARSANMYGGTGLAINAGAAREEQEAAWLFLVWATSPETQLAGLKSEVGGGTPTRGSLYERPEVREGMQPPTDMPNLLTYEAVEKAWRPENIGLRPKIPSWNECDTIIFTELSKMLAGSKTPEEAMRSAKRSFDETQQRVQSLG